MPRDLSTLPLFPDFVKMAVARPEQQEDYHMVVLDMEASVNTTEWEKADTSVPPETDLGFYIALNLLIYLDSPY